MIHSITEFCLVVLKISILLWQDGPAYVHVFVRVLCDIHKEETVEYVLALIDEMLAGNLRILGFVFVFFCVAFFITSGMKYNLFAENPKRARLFHDKALADEDTYEPFLSYVFTQMLFPVLNL